MKNVLLISTLLTVALAAHPANALTSESVSITETGGVVIEGGANAEGSSDASAGVWSVIQSDGGSTDVRVDIRTAADGEARATTVERTIEGKERFDVSARTSQDEVAVDSESEVYAGTETATTSELVLFGRFSAFLQSIFNFFLFFW